MKTDYSFVVNGTPRTIQAWPMERLLDVLRNQLGLTGTKEACGEGECGACSVLVNGALTNSCLVPVAQVSGAEIVSIEGIAAEGELHGLQQAFVQCGAAQCGMCTPGMIVAGVHLLRKHPTPTAQEIREGLNGNLCRCTGYSRIFAAVEAASARSRP